MTANRGEEARAFVIDTLTAMCNQRPAAGELIDGGDVIVLDRSSSICESAMKVAPCNAGRGAASDL
jgi:hypothetical protein